MFVTYTATKSSAAGIVLSSRKLHVHTSLASFFAGDALESNSLEVVFQDQAEETDGTGEKLDLGSKFSLSMCLIFATVRKWNGLRIVWG